MPRSPTAALATLALLAAAPLAAQTVVGEFVDPVTAGGIAGARVKLQDAAERTVQAALTDAAGSFRIMAPEPGRYTVLAERIGYAPTRSPTLLLGRDAEVHHRLVSETREVQLPAVVVRGRARCVRRPGDTQETAVVWEEARKALDLARATAAGRLHRFRIQAFVRELDPVTRKVRGERQTIREGYDERPFVTVPLERLDRYGFIEQAGDTLVYHGPDAEVLLSDVFLDAHCFRLRAPGPEEAGMIGLAFEPVRGRRVPDIRGVLWLDRASAELRHVDFEYTRPLISGPAGVPGGRVDFQRLPDGAWIVSHWTLRMPLAALAAGPSRGRMEWGYRLTAIREEGGRVLDVSARD
jgi:hypothetical protein